MKKIIFLTLFAALSWQHSVAQQFTDGTLWYNVYSGTTSVEVAAKNKAAIGTDIAIPAQVSYNGADYTVASIASNAFQFDYLLTSVTIPNSVQSIGNGAFKMCYALTSITIPDSVVRIGDSAFEYCQGLKSVTIGNSVRGIDNATFYGCSALTAIAIPNSVTSIGTGAFGGCSGLTSVTIPEGVRSIGIDAFNSCAGLKSVTIPSSILYIQERAFFSCTNLTSVICNIAAPLTINADTFQNSNQSICSLTVPSSSVPSYQAKAVWQNFNAILCDNQAINTTTASACQSYTWALNNQTYTASGVYYSGLSGDCLTEKLDLTITTVFSYNGLNYVFTSPTTVAVGNNQGASGSITIPSSVTNSCGTYSVTSISDQAFISCPGITSVAIPNSVTQIGAFAFYDCTGLTSANISNSVDTIGVYAFGNCTSLRSVAANWTTPIGIDRNVFEGANLANIALNVPDGTQAAYNDAAIWTDFNLNGQEIIAGQTIVANGINYVVTKTTAPYEVAVGSNTNFIGVPTLLTEVVHNGNSYAVTSIADQAFYGSQSITGIEIPNSVTRIGSEAFLSCRNLTSVTIGNAVTSIGRSAFSYCTGLTSIMLPNSLTTIEEGAFSQCSGLTSITLPDSVTTFDYGVFQQCTGLTSVIISNSITSIAGTFYGCTSLTSIIIPNSVTSIGDYTFEGCAGLTSVAIPNSVTNIGNGAFQNCSSLTSISIGNAVTSIGNSAFYYCSKLTSCTIPNSVTTIGGGAFSGCNALASVTLPNALTTIENDTFYLCRSLTSVSIPKSVTRIDEIAFGRCTGLTSVTVDWTTPIDIDSSVFENILLERVLLSVPTNTQAAYAVASVWKDFNVNGTRVLTGQTFAVNGINYIVTKATLPYEVAVSSNTTFVGPATIAANVANNGNSFTVTSIAAQAFNNCTGLTSVTFSNSVTSIAAQAFNNCTGLTSVTFSNSVTSIGAQTFYNCTGLTSVTIPNSVKSIGNEAFGSCTGLNAVTVNWTTPINIISGKYDYPFDNYGSNITLNIPTGTKFAYQKSDWSEFTIVEPVTSIYNYCKGAVATPLVAPFVAGSTVKWYTVATGGTALKSTPTPLTTTAGTKLYYVSQVVGGLESARQTITVNTIALPETPIAINGTAAQGALVGTDITATYTIAAVAGATSYVWTAPAGVNIVDGQGTNSITVNFADVPAGAGAIGNIAVVAVNTAGCNSSAKTLALTKALPVAPTAIKMTDDLLPIPDTGIPTPVTSFAKYMGTNTELTLTATPVATATSYEWELPEGVTQLSGGTSNEIKVHFAGVTSTNTYNYTTTATIPVPSNVLRIGVKAKNGVGVSVTSNGTLVNPTTDSTARLLTLTAVKPAAPSAIKMTDAAALDPTKAITVTSSFIGTTKELTLTATPSAVASSYSWELPTGVNLKSTGNTNVITVDFAGVAAGTAALSIGVKAVNGVGSSATKELKLTAAAPTAPSAITMTDAAALDSTKAITVISSFIGTTKELTLTATLSAAASSYSWELPTGVNLKATGNTNVITVDFAGVVAGTTALSIGVKAVNGVGSSATKELKLTATIPATVSKVDGQITGLCGNVLYTYTITPSVLATSYLITAPTGAKVTSASNMTNTTNILSTSDLSFAVTYPNGFVATTTSPKSIVVIATNGVGPSLTNRTLALSTLMPAIGTVTGGATFTRCGTQTFSVPAIVGATNYLWKVADGAQIVSGQGTTTVVVNFAGVLSSKMNSKLTVTATNGCGVSSATKSITLTSIICLIDDRFDPKKVKNDLALNSVTELYPNPTSNSFSIDVLASKATVLNMTITTLTGAVVQHPRAVELSEGNNTFSENIASLPRGIYLVQLVNTSNNELITKKLIKE